MASRISTLCLLAANILIPIAILTFASGFFPYKPFLPGLAEYETLGHGPPPKAHFDKVIFMVVDALRSDFVYTEDSGFKFVQGLISSGAALPFTAHATSPTITMPRIKAITTGSIPSFLDVILNFAESDTTSTLASQDTWLAQMKAKKSGKMVMYGDDTWLKLFPQTFDRAEGTSSFFVSDFTEVDHNVTRHVPGELKNDDWNTMVLHYLGLDHIGHKAGPRSPNMIPKQHEMDGIVNQIYQAMESNKFLGSTLLVLAGDHGMNDAGNHGGSAPGETSPALVFISPKLKAVSSGSRTPAEFKEDFQYYNTIEQSDIAPTLGGLLGFPVPRNNLGAFIPQFLPFWPNKNDQVQILLRNARQILAVVTAAFPSFESVPLNNCGKSASDIDELACNWKNLMNTVPNPKHKRQDIEAWLLGMTKWLNQAQDIMSSAASNYDVTKLAGGIAVAALAFFLALGAATPTISKSLNSSSPVLGISLLYGIMMFASSYVEEEQHFWYWATSAWLFLIYIKSARKDHSSTQSRYRALTSLAIMILFRIARRWVQTGQKHAGAPSISTPFLTSSHRLLLWSLITLTYLWNLQSLAARGFPRFPPLIAGSIATLLATAALTFKIAFTHEDSPEIMAGMVKTMGEQEAGISLITRARILFSFLGLAAVYTVFSGFFHQRKPNPTLHTLHDLLTLLLITQSRAQNIPLLLLCEIIFILLYSMNLSTVEIATTTLLLQYSTFFAFGGSNAISSIDLSSAYNGVSGYNITAVGILLFLSNWSGPIFWMSAGNLMVLRKRKSGEKNVWRTHVALGTVFITGSLLSVMVACMVLRSHLFIWTVFSPKYLYAMAWGVGSHLGINVVVGGGLYALGGLYL